ncbi:MAG: glycosyltransferase family 4 protein [Anaerolineae bacterium]|nr:glycosyltransferase family 4 protein [Anaerolineae bacterium]
MRLLLFNLVTDADSVAQGFTTTWINALARRCEAIDVITMRAGRIAVADNVRVYSVGKERGYSEARRLLEFYRLLNRLLRQQTYDAAFAHMNTLFAILAAPLLRLRHIPLTLWYAHGAVSPRLRLAEKLADHCVSSSADGFRITSRKLTLIGQGIDTERFRPGDSVRPPAQPFTIISVSRLAPVKRIEDIIGAAGVLAKHDTPFQLRIYGDAAPEHAAYKQQLVQQAAALGLETQLMFCGSVAYDAIVPVYQHADVVVNASETGSLDKAVLEAMACGLPVVTANPAFRDVLSEDLLVPLGAPEQLAEHLRQIQALSPEQRAEMGTALREIVVRDHSLERLVNRLFEIFTSEGG